MEASYDFIYGGATESQPVNNLRQTLRQTRTENLTDAATTEDLRARIRTLEYESVQWKKDRDVMQLKYDKDLDEARARLEAELRKASTAQNSEKTAADRLEALARDFRDERERWTSERSDLERKARTAAGQRDTLQEEIDDVQEQLGNQEREFTRRLNESNARHDGLQKTYNQLKEDFEHKDNAFRNAQQKVIQQEERLGELEAEILQLKASSEDVGTIALLRGELAEQNEYMKRMEEAAARFETQMLDMKKSRVLQAQLESDNELLRQKALNLENVQAELDQVRLRNQALESEKSAWASYLQDQAISDVQIDSPEDLARAYMRERIARNSLEQDVGSIQAELNGKDLAIKALEEARAAAQAELTKLKGDAPASAGSAVDGKTRLRLERQKALAVKEAEYLRAQLKAMETEAMEDGEADPSQTASNETTTRVQQLEDLLEQHRHETEVLNKQLNELEKTVKQAEQQRNGSSVLGTKRSAESNENVTDERVGELTRRNRHLQNDISRLQSKYTMLENESKAQEAQLLTLRQKSKTRVLEFKDNPTARAEKIKLSTLEALKQENEVLKQQVAGLLPTTQSNTGTTGTTDDRLIPRSSLQSLELLIDEKNTLIASKEKSLTRLKDVFRAKGGEFVEAVYSLLGYKLEFMPNGRVRVRSMYHPNSGLEPTKNKPIEADEEEAFIMFDGEAGTMKVSGGTNSLFAKEIRGLLDFWVEGRGSVPCLLAAMTLEFWDRYREGDGQVPNEDE